ncbi:hypothetical protein [Neomegalonema sp.]|uniref:hypothetical protein n=1 Tax=Neomegalonema sp. TaxID=2039713 RepID=UPI002625E434|nr:hypothetical protein [Neomegalonema sp.]MDD2868936.1 hypothetical protein [Neomegalonema sp.]
MTPIRIKPGVRALALTTTAFIALAGVAQEAHAATAANTVIRNQATATYQDAGGNSYQAQSNIAELTVQQVYDATISQDRSKTGAAGQTVYSSHTLTNQGNGEAWYRISVANVTGDSGDFTALQVFRDLNGNGVADAGEPVLASGAGTTSLVRLNGAEAAQLLIAAQLPNGAAAAAGYASVITAAPVDAAGATGSFGVVRDTTPAGQTNAYSDATPTTLGANHLLVTVTSDAVLEVTKAAVINTATGEIAYTVTVRNTGGRAATDVRIFDALPDGVTLVGGSIVSTGFGGNAGDVAAVAVANIDETTYGQDYNNDGDVVDAALVGVEGRDALLPAGASVQLTFRVTYNPATVVAGTQIINTAYAAGDLDGVPGEEDPVPSNPAQVEAAPVRALTLVDTGVNGANGVNDGGDDDNASDGVQLVDTAPLGATVIFKNIVTNTGNSPDRFNLSVPAGHSFPAGTLFSFWNENGSVQLLDTNGDGVPNTPTLAVGAPYTFQVRAILPQTATLTPGTPYDASTVATSVGDATRSATVINRLGEITAAGVDLANSNPGVWNAGDAVDAYNAAAATATATTTLPAAVGGVASFPLHIKNFGGVSDSFQLYAGGGWFAGAAVGSRLQALPDGWSVRFLNAAGQQITTTPAVQSGGVYSLTAVVQVPSDYAQALANYTADFRSQTASADASLDALVDGAYPIFFSVRSQSTGVSDVKLDAVKVSPDPRYQLSADKDEQPIAPGAASRTDHTLTNTGNTPGEYDLTVASSDPSWGSTIWVDTNGDGVPDRALETIPDGSPVFVRNPDGTTTSVNLVNGGKVPLAPGQEIPVWIDVQAPTSASVDQRVTVTLSGTDGATTQTTRVPYRVATGVLRLTKTAAVDALCAGVALDDLGPDGAFTENASRANPGDCAVWEIVGANVGTEPVNTIVVSDAVPDFTTYVANTGRFCLENTSSVCTFAASPPLAGFNVSGSGDITLDASGLLTGGELLPGQTFRIRFSTRIQ